MHDRVTLDVLDLILASLPDLRTLNSTIKVSKRIYQVYKAHAKSIRASVARNEVGPSLLSACRSLKIQRMVRHDDFDEEPLSMDKILDLSGEAETDVHDVLTDWSCARELSRNAQRVALLEEFYSRRSDGLQSMPFPFHDTKWKPKIEL